ncbi:MAG: hypothetical protein ACP5XB_06820 [Isosphaeraceae bacterium]
MGWKRHATGDLAEDPEPLVLIPRESLPWQLALCLVPLAAAIVYRVFLFTGRLLAPRWMNSTGLWPFGPFELLQRLMFVFWCFWGFAPAIVLATNRYAEFAVWKDGLTLATARINLKRSTPRGASWVFIPGTR